MPLIVGITVVVFVTLGIAAYCGINTGEWMELQGLPEARQALQAIPKTIGRWETVAESVLDADSTAQLQVQGGNFVRRYRNTQTMAEVNLILMVGPTGKVTAHTPETCFGGRDYTQEGDRERITVGGPIKTESTGTESTDEEAADKTDTEIEGGNDAFWKVNFVNNAVRGDTISFYYAHNIGNGWEALDNPRYSFRFKKFAYKMQAEAYVINDQDVVRMFVQECVPEIQKHILPCPDRWNPGF